MALARSRRSVLWIWLAGLVVVSTGLIAAGGWFYRTEAEALRRSKHDEIAAIGALKAGQIRQWRGERLAAADRLARDPLVWEAIEELLQTPDSRRARSHLLGRLQVERDQFVNANALILTPDGDPLVAAVDEIGPVAPATERAIAAARDRSAPQLSDPYRGEDGRISIDAVAMVRDMAGRVLGISVLRSDANAYLYPLIESWPTPSPSAETFLVQRDGDRVLWLNNSRHVGGAALAMRQPLADTSLPAAQAVLGTQGVFEGQDYRGVAVLADLRHIEGSPWFMVAKIDLDEVLADVRYRARVISLVVALVILLAAALSAFAYQRRTAWLAGLRDELEARRRAAQQAAELMEAERIAGMGSYTWTIATGSVRWSDGLNMLLRRAPGLPPPAFDALARFYTPSGWEALQASAARVIAGGPAETIEVEMVRDDGTTFWTQSWGEALRGPDGAVEAIRGTVHDIDARHRAATELRQREERYLLQRNALIDLMKSDAFNGDDLEQALRQITEVAATTLGAARVSIWRYTDNRSAIRCDDLYSVDARGHSSGTELPESMCPAYFRALVASPVIVADDARADPRTAELSEHYLVPLGITSMLDAPVHLRGSVTGVLCHEHVGSSRRWTADESAFAVAVANAVSLVLEGEERRRAEAGLRLQSAALNAAASAIVITNRSGDIEWVNPAFTALTGFTEHDAIGRNPRELIKSGAHDRAFYAALWDTILAGRVWRGEITNRRRDGTTYLEGMSITPVRAGDGEISHFVAIKRDLTERKEMEARLLHAQKMEVVGRLAGGIAHDFNNLLTIINGMASLIAEGLEQGNPIRRDVEEIQIAGARAATLTRQLLVFSRKEVMNPEVISLTALVAGLRSMLQRIIGEDITLTVAPAVGGSWVKADRGQMEQVLMNLVVNARDAMPQGGVITVAVEDVEPDDAHTGADGCTQAGPHVLVRVRDTGTGMDQATRARLFEPFFTTKEPGKGTGLGLATVYSIIKQHGGTIAVESAPGQGATFTICLPRVADPNHPAPGEAPASIPATAATLLVVEDEDLVRRATRRMLEFTGYRVLTAACGADALELLARSDERIDLVLTDVVMPGMSGPELEAQVALIRPETRILYMSGHTDNDTLRSAVLDRSARFIGKPFSREDLARAVRDALQSPAASALPPQPPSR